MYHRFVTAAADKPLMAELVAAVDKLLMLVLVVVADKPQSLVPAAVVAAVAEVLAAQGAAVVLGPVSAHTECCWYLVSPINPKGIKSVSLCNIS